MDAAVLVLLIAIVGACAAVEPAASNVAPTVPISGSGGTPAVAEFLRTPLVDVRTGETFTLADRPGAVTIVQGMAVW